MRQTNLKNVARAGVFFYIAACSQKTHIHMPHTFACQHVQKSVHEQTHKYKTAVHGSKLMSQGSESQDRWCVWWSFFTLSLSFSLSCYKASLRALEYADDSFQRRFILPAPREEGLVSASQNQGRRAIRVHSNHCRHRGLLVSHWWASSQKSVELWNCWNKRSTTQKGDLRKYETCLNGITEKQVRAHIYKRLI